MLTWRVCCFVLAIVECFDEGKSDCSPEFALYKGEKIGGRHA